MHRLLPGVVLGLLAGLATPASASDAGILLHARPVAVVAANRSQNWFGYNQGAMEKGTLFHSISAAWTVPAATQRRPGEAEYSATWAGIGGGCVDAPCDVVDDTLIQAGTEQDVSAAGAPQYSAWWELLPGPSMAVSGMVVRPGDQMTLSIAETRSNSEVWDLVLKDASRHESFAQVVPYSSSYASAEWIEEAPVVVGSGGGIAPLPNLSVVAFDSATANGFRADLTPAEEMEMVDSAGKVRGLPSAPDSEQDGFNDCAWASSCSAPHASSTSSGVIYIHTRWATVGG